MEIRENELVLEEGIRFFGTMAASISHEITNSLAIINENAGLIDDFTLMAERGHPIDPARLRSIAGKVTRQIQRADEIVKNLNTFAHSTDEKVASIDLNASIALVSALCSRLASRKGVSLERPASQDPVPIRTAPFLLEHLLWRCLDFAVEVAGERRSVAVHAERTGSGVHVRFAWLESISTIPMERFATREVKGLLELLHAGFRTDPDAGELVLILPEDIGQLGDGGRNKQEETSL